MGDEVGIACGPPFAKVSRVSLMGFQPETSYSILHTFYFTSEVLMTIEEATTSAQQPASLPDGIWLGARDLGDGKVSFALWAPWKKGVHLIGSFNDWDRSSDPLAVSEQ